MSTASTLKQIVTLLTGSAGGSDVAGVVAANAKLDLIVTDLGINSSGSGASGAPVLNNVSPATVAVAGGTSFTLTGTGFTGATLVNFTPAGAAAIPATGIVVVNDTTITGISPALPAGSVAVTVLTPLGTSPASTATAA